MVGNSQDGCACLDLIDLPKYPYYHRFITIEAYDAILGARYKAHKRFKLVDYIGDDDTCEEYYDSSNFQIYNEDNFEFESGTTVSIDELDIEGYSSFEAYDILGRLVMKGTSENFSMHIFPKNELIFLVLFNKKRSERRIQRVVVLD